MTRRTNCADKSRLRIKEFETVNQRRVSILPSARIKSQAKYLSSLPVHKIRTLKHTIVHALDSQGGCKRYQSSSIPILKIMLEREPKEDGKNPIRPQSRASVCWLHNILKLQIQLTTSTNQTKRPTRREQDKSKMILIDYATVP
jgi:hypothetical protein